MKYLKINYGNNNKHNVIVKELLKKDDNLYIIYYDLTKHSEKSSQIILNNENYLKGQDIDINIINNIKENCQILEPKILPKELNCTENSDQILKAKYYDIKLNDLDKINVLIAKSGMYIEEEIINDLNIDSNKTKTFDNKKYKLVTKEIIENIEKNKKLKIHYKEIAQKQSYFLVYNDNSNLYIDEYIANLFKLKTTQNIKHINNKNYVQIKEENINYIENITKNLDTKLNAKYITLN